MQRRAVGGSSGVAGVERAATGRCRRRRCEGAALACCHCRRSCHGHRRGAGGHITLGAATWGPTVTYSSSSSSCPWGQQHPLSATATVLMLLQGSTVPLQPQGRVELRALAPAAGTQARGGTPRPLLLRLPLTVLEPVSERADEACWVHWDMLCGEHTRRSRLPF